jgi:hypothetical protein
MHWHVRTRGQWQEGVAGVQTKSSGGWNEERTSSGGGWGGACACARCTATAGGGGGVTVRVYRGRVCAPRHNGMEGQVEEWGGDRAGFACISRIAKVKN